MKNNSKRNSILSALLSLMLPGAGQIYNAQYKTGFIYLFTYLLLISTYLIDHFTLFIAATLCGIFLHILSSVNAFYFAKNNKNLSFSKFNNIFLYVIFVLIFNNFAIDITTSNFKSYKVTYKSMMPSLNPGDFLFASKKYYSHTAPKYGDIIVFKHPLKNKVDIVKRVVGLPKDKIQIKNGVLFINSQEIKKTKIREDVTILSNEKSIIVQVYSEVLPNNLNHETYDYFSGDGDNTGIFNVPRDHYFVLGDNRDNSLDSRLFGFISLDNIKHKVLSIGLKIL